MASNLQYSKPRGETVKYLEQYFVSPTRTGYVTCQDTVLPEYFTHFGDRIRGIDIRPDDIWVCSFPKAGTTLTQEMVWCIANNTDLEAAEKSLSKRFPFLEASAMFDLRGMMSDVGDKVDPHFTQNSVDRVVQLASPRFIKTHLPFNLLPEKLQRNETKAKIVYVTRNARDTCISFFHHCRSTQGYTGTFEQFCELFLEGNVPFGPFWNHIQSFWKLRSESHILILRYEDMRKDLKSAILKTANFLEKSLSDDQIIKLLDHLSFEKMKENPAVNKHGLLNFKKRLGMVPDKHENFMRAGKVGEWKEVMDTKLVQRFEKWQQKNLKNVDESLVEFFNCAE